MKNLKYYIYSFCLATLAVSCSNDTPDNIKDIDQIVYDDPVDELKFSEKANVYVDYEADFALKMLQYQVDNEEGTIAFSPLGAYEVLAMTANANDGDVSSEIISVMTDGRITDLEALNEYNRIMIKVLPNLDNSVTFYNNNAIASITGLELESDYETLMNVNFMPEIINFDTYSDCRRLINEWAARTTNNMIPEFLQHEIASPIILLNSNYFKGAWKYEFMEHSLDGTFENIDGTISTVEYLMPYNKITAFSNEKITGVVMPVGEGAFSFVALMPTNKRETLSEMVNALDKTTLDNYVSNVKEIRCGLRLPRFEVETGLVDCIKMLQQLGFRKMFTTPFRGIIKDQEIAIDRFVQKTKLCIDRDGMEAASVTADFLISGTGSEVPTENPYSFDRPFVFFVRENSTGAILYIGQVKNLPNVKK